MYEDGLRIYNAGSNKRYNCFDF